MRACTILIAFAASVFARDYAPVDYMYSADYKYTGAYNKYAYAKDYKYAADYSSKDYAYSYGKDYTYSKDYAYSYSGNMDYAKQYAYSYASDSYSYAKDYAYASQDYAYSTYQKYASYATESAPVSNAFPTLSLLCMVMIALVKKSTN